MDRGLVRVLNKGPSFVNAEPKNLPMFCLKARASLQSATDRLKEQSIPECAINEFKGGIARVINECEQLGPKILKTKKLPYKRPPKHVAIISTDKTKRLIALDTEQYKDMVDISTIKTGNYEQNKRLNQPRTEQIRFNGQLNKTADNLNYGVT